MDSIIKRMSERLATQSSRRGFFSKMGKAMLGAAALGSAGLAVARLARRQPWSRDSKTVSSTETPGWSTRS